MITALEVKNLSMRFGGLLAVDDLSFEVQRDTITSIIGPNGAGKTTLFNCLTGFYKPTSGVISCATVTEAMQPIHHWPGYRIARDAKIARTFQNIRLFPQMTLLENLLVAQHERLMKASFFSINGLLRSREYRDAEKTAIEKSMHWLGEVGLGAFANENAANLPYGAQRRLEIARALCLEPKILCLDEPAAGLNPKETEELNALLLKIREQCKLTILLIEHDMRVVMRISDWIIVLDHGQKIAEGVAKTIQSDPAVISAYLGTVEGAHA